jgi:hypothetical protein
MYEEAKIREARNKKKLKNYENEQKIINEKEHTFKPNLSKSKSTIILKENKKDLNNKNFNVIDFLKRKKENKVHFIFQVKFYLFTIFYFLFPIFLI